MKQKKILISGHRGLIGSNICQELDKENISYDTILQDMRNPIQLRNTQYEYFVHCASNNGGISYNQSNPADVFADNVLMDLNALKCCVEYKIPNFISFATSCGYPSEDDKLYELSYLNGVPDSTVESHGYAKRNLLLAANYYYNQYDVKSIILVPNTVYGPGNRLGNRAKVIMALIQKLIQAKVYKNRTIELLGTGNVYREFTYVKHVSQIVVEIIKKKIQQVGFSPLINIGPSNELLVIDLLKYLMKKINVDSYVYYNTEFPDGVYRKSLSYSKQEAYKLMPSKIYSFDEAIDETIKWYCKEKGFNYEEVIQ